MGHKRTSVWQQAACLPAKVDPDLFHSDHDADQAAALAICATCSITDPCLDAAIAGDELGVWGGTTRAQRLGKARVDDATAARIADAIARAPVRDGSPAHGTNARYARGCACPRCRRAHADDVAVRRARAS